MILRTILLAPVLLLAAPASAAPAQVRCSFDDADAVACTMHDAVGADGLHRMTFAGGGKRMTFVGRPLTGWWVGRLAGRPGMGYERNRGNVVFASSDGQVRFAWWYPGQEHGSY